ncbi:hypothetical protein H2200_008782 [Cladophialophora chaetospira]|uniref:F-box domain-containing protein n=1 Tax=Cladophialophora chaetospira TaxID=386627 RepID=A0AA39CFM4_9EURO|nr:hypothetical protein H2200_008782 [Cladophialophora chaetospira]
MALRLDFLLLCLLMLGLASAIPLASQHHTPMLLQLPQNAPTPPHLLDMPTEVLAMILISYFKSFRPIEPQNATTRVARQLRNARDRTAILLVCQRITAVAKEHFLSNIQLLIMSTPVWCNLSICSIRTGKVALGIRSLTLSPRLLLTVASWDTIITNFSELRLLRLHSLSINVPMVPSQSFIKGGNNYLKAMWHVIKELKGLKPALDFLPEPPMIFPNDSEYGRLENIWREKLDTGLMILHCIYDFYGSQLPRFGSDHSLFGTPQTIEWDPNWLAPLQDVGAIRERL